MSTVSATTRARSPTASTMSRIAASDGSSPGRPCGGVIPTWSAPASMQARASSTDCIV